MSPEWELLNCSTPDLSAPCTANRAGQHPLGLQRQSNMSDEGSSTGSIEPQA